MDTTYHSLKDLFDQLGLASGRQDVAEFIARHAPLSSSIELAQAAFWAPDQRDFLKEELLKDADWAESIDLLNVLLRERR